MNEVIATLGTSITAGIAPEYQWQRSLDVALTERARRRSTVVNFGISGGNSYDGLAILPRVMALRPRAVTIEYTANDAYSPYDISIEQCEANTLEIIGALRGQDARVGIYLLIMNPCVLGSAAAAARPQYQAYNDVYRSIAAADSSAVLIDTYSRWGELDPTDFEQGIHPVLGKTVESAIPIMREYLWPLLR